MAPTCSTIDQIPPLKSRDGERLLDAAQWSIELGLVDQDYPVFREAALPPQLRRRQPCFVTLRIDDELRGCVGAVGARRALLNEVAAHAYEAAFEDRRFSPLMPAEYPLLSMSVAVLGPLERRWPHSAAAAAECLVAGVHGAVVRSGRRSAVFLPSVWELLPDPRQFIAQLLRKAGLDPFDWPAKLRFDRFETQCFRRFVDDHQTARRQPAT